MVFVRRADWFAAQRSLLGVLRAECGIYWINGVAGEGCVERMASSEEQRSSRAGRSSRARKVLAESKRSSTEVSGQARGGSFRLWRQQDWLKQIILNLTLSKEQTTELTHTHACACSFTATTQQSLLHSCVQEVAIILLSMPCLAIIMLRKQEMLIDLDKSLINHWNKASIDQAAISTTISEAAFVPT